jgi:glycosyltransferase involved in cell wall biosynthesis
MTLAEKHSVRILHVVGGMVRGGVETWLMQILRNIDRDRLHMDFLVHTDQPCAYDDEVRTLGSQILPCLEPSQLLLYRTNFKKILREYGPYDIIHSHVHHFSGYILYLAKNAGIPIRIAHSHLDSSPLEVKAGLHRRLYLTFTKGLIARYANIGLGCSHTANADLFGRDWMTKPNRRLFYCGIDMKPFRESIDALSVRTELGIPGNALVIGHVGRFQKQKNHRFVIEVFAEVVRREPQAYLLLVGEGPMRPNIEQQVLHMGLEKRVIFTGSRSDIPRLMRGAMNVFLLPSISEGLPIVGIEAQAAGLPLIVSDVITDEFHKIKPLVHQLSLSESASVWADTVLAVQNTAVKINQADSLAVMENSEFNIAYSMKELVRIYTYEQS